MTKVHADNLTGQTDIGLTMTTSAQILTCLHSMRLCVCVCACTTISVDKLYCYLDNWNKHILSTNKVKYPKWWKVFLYYHSLLFTGPLAEPLHMSYFGKIGQC